MKASYISLTRKEHALRFVGIKHNIVFESMCMCQGVVTKA